MLQYIKRFFNGSKDAYKGWGTERAVVDLLQPCDRDWVSIRYRLCLEYLNGVEIVLDAACGSGFGSQILSQKAREVYGIDISKEAVAYARKRHGKENTSFKVGDVGNLKFKDDFFDVSVGIETIEHIEDYNAYLQEFKRVTTNNGKVIISTPQKKSEIPLTPFHVKEFEFEEFKSLLQKYFVIEKIIGLKRQQVPVVEKVTDENYMDFDIYLAFCRNTKYIEENYSDDYYKGVNDGYFYNPAGRLHAKAMSLALVGSSILSIGCGSGSMESEISTLSPNLEITCTDIVSTPILDKLRAENGVKDFYLINADSVQQPFVDDGFDTVYTAHVLEHVPDPKKLIVESIRLTRCLACHLIPINLINPDHIHFFKFDKIDNEYRTQEANIDLKVMADEIIEELRPRYPNLIYELEVVCPRDGSVDYGDIEFNIKRDDRPDGLMPCFLIKFYKYGEKS